MQALTVQGFGEPGIANSRRQGRHSRRADESSDLKWPQVAVVQYFEQQQMVGGDRVETDGISLLDSVSWDLVPVAVCFILLYGIPTGTFKNLNSQWLSGSWASHLLCWDK